MAVFIEKSPVTCSNCYNTIKTASTLQPIALATTCSGLNFLLPWQQGDISKLPKKQYFALIFSIKIDFKVLQLLNGSR
jgi:hypothetical protein